MMADFDPRSRKYGELASEKLFAGRKGHGGGECSRRVLNRNELAAICACAFEMGLRAAARADGEKS